MGVFRLMRSAHETPDRVTGAIANYIGQCELDTGARKSAYKSYTIAAGPDPARFLEFWEMKRTEELTADEAPAVWVVLMRTIPVEQVLRLVLLNCIHAGTPNTGDALSRLWNYRDVVLRTAQRATPPRVCKLRTNLCARLREAASQNNIVVLDPLDAHLLLSACETAIVVQKEEERRCHAENR